METRQATNIFAFFKLAQADGALFRIVVQTVVASVRLSAEETLVRMRECVALDAHWRGAAGELYHAPLLNQTHVLLQTVRIKPSGWAQEGVVVRRTRKRGVMVRMTTTGRERDQRRRGKVMIPWPTVTVDEKRLRIAGRGVSRLMMHLSRSGHARHSWRRNALHWYGARRDGRWDRR